MAANGAAITLRWSHLKSSRERHVSTRPSSNMSGIFDNLKLPLNIDVQTKCKYDDWHDMTAPVYAEQTDFSPFLV